MKKSIVRYALLCMVIFIIGKTLLFWAYIPSISMEPTLSVGNIVLGNRLDRIPDRYDIILFWNPENKKQVLIKRVIGLPGEKIEMKSGCIYVDGQKINEPYLQEKYNDSGSYQVSQNSYFVMGDNRNHSYDSRDFFSIPQKDVLAKAVCVVYPRIKDLSEKITKGEENGSYKISRRISVHRSNLILDGSCGCSSEDSRRL